MKYFVLVLTTIFAVLISSNTSAAISTSLADIPSGDYELDKTHASLIWKIKHLGLSSYTARFTNFDAKIKFNSQKPEQSALVAVIDATSIKTDYPYPEKKDFDKKLIQGNPWFNADDFETITFVSETIELKDSSNGVIKGQLTLLGVTKPVQLDVVFNGAYAKHPFIGKAALGFSAFTKIKRSEWGMDSYIPKIADEVEVIIESEFIKAD